MAGILESINGPEDLKKLNLKELQELADEIREYIVDVVSKTGGHLAPNLGVVELTLALHYVLNSPDDKILFDVSHQSYVHKILTGRRELFRTLRQFGGLSGFTSREESPHDFYTTGHASGSLSYAMGVAEGFRKLGLNNRVAVVIGDGALTGGVAYEALNNIGHMKTPVLIILNDNEMSIAKNVGAISSYLSRLRLDPKYNQFREEVEKFLKSMPLIGERIYHIGDSLRESLKALLTPGMLFEEFGIRYFGPIDGHNLDRLIKAISWSVNLNEPVVLHLVTRKGKGYEPAEKHPEYFHGSSAFNKETGKPAKKSDSMSFTEVFSNAITKLAAKDERIIAITAAMPSGTGLSQLAEKYPDRFYDVGIAEQTAVALSAGLAAAGFKPVCAIYSTFLQRAYDQIIQDVALQKLPVVFAIDRGGLVGEDGPTHHGVFDLSYLKTVPGLVVAAPSTGTDLIRVLKAAIQYDGPFAFRYPRGDIPEGKLKESDYDTDAAVIGKGRYLRRGKDIALIAIGRAAFEAKQAADILEKEGIDVTVFDAVWLKPLDAQEIELILKNHRIVITVEENNLKGGFGESVNSFVAASDYPARVYNLGINDEFLPHGKPSQLLHLAGIDAEKIANVVLALRTDVEKLPKIKDRIRNIFRINGKSQKTS